MYLPPDAICCRNDHNTFSKHYPCTEEKEAPADVNQSGLSFLFREVLSAGIYLPAGAGINRSCFFRESSAFLLGIKIIKYSFFNPEYSQIRFHAFLDFDCLVFDAEQSDRFGDGFVQDPPPGPVCQSAHFGKHDAEVEYRSVQIAAVQVAGYRIREKDMENGLVYRIPETYANAYSQWQLLMPEEISSLLPENMLRIIQNAVIASNTAIV